MSPRAGTLLGMAVNALLAVGKITAGLVCVSQAILADGVHSASDLVTDVAVLASLRMSDKPADTCHPYGHRRVATLAALFGQEPGGPFQRRLPVRFQLAERS